MNFIFSFERESYDYVLLINFTNGNIFAYCARLWFIYHENVYSGRCHLWLAFVQDLIKIHFSSDNDASKVLAIFL